MLFVWLMLEITYIMDLFFQHIPVTSMLYKVKSAIWVLKSSFPYYVYFKQKIVIWLKILKWW